MYSAECCTYAASQEKYESEIHELKQTVTELEVRCVKLAGQRGHGEGSEESRDHTEGKDCADGMDDNSSENTTDIFYVKAIIFYKWFKATLPCDMG